MTVRQSADMYRNIISILFCISPLFSWHWAKDHDLQDSNVCRRGSEGTNVQMSSTQALPQSHCPHPHNPCRGLPLPISIPRQAENLLLAISLGTILGTGAGSPSGGIEIFLKPVVGMRLVAADCWYLPAAVAEFHTDLANALGSQTQHHTSG
jgi:hypothetical protein